MSIRGWSSLSAFMATFHPRVAECCSIRQGQETGSFTQLCRSSAEGFGARQVPLAASVSFPNLCLPFLLRL